MPKPIYLFLFLLLSCSFLLCFYYAEIEQNVSRRFGPSGGLRNLRSSDALTGAKGGSRLTPPTSVRGEDNTTVLVYRIGADKAESPETIHLSVILCNVGQKAGLEKNFRRMLSSMVRHLTNESLHFHLVTDKTSWEVAKEVIHEETFRLKKDLLSIQVMQLNGDCYYNEFIVM